MANNAIHELVMLYLSKRDISSLTPEQLYDEYAKTYTAIEQRRHPDDSAFVQIG